MAEILLGHDIVLVRPVSLVPDLDFTVYDAYVDTIGLLFYEAAQAQTRTAPLRPVRSDVGNNPFETRPESGDTFAQGDFTHGGLQAFFHRPGRDEKKFYLSEGADISEAGKIKHLYKTGEAVDSTSVGAIEVIADLPLVAVGNVVKRGNGSFPGTWADETLGGVTVNDLSSSGAVGFAALNSTANPIYTRAAGGTTWAAYQIAAANVTLDTTSRTATKLAWVKDRLMVVGAKASAGDALYEISTSATPPAIHTLPTGWSFENIFEAGPFIYACAVNPNSGQSKVFHYGLNAAGTAIELKGGTEFPRGQLVYTGAGYLNGIYLLGGRRNKDGGYDPFLYIAQQDGTGFLSYVKIAQEKGSGALDLATRAVDVNGDGALFGWSLTNASPSGTREGLASHHLARDAFAHHVKKNAAAGTPNRITDIALYKNRILFTVNGDGLFYEDVGAFTQNAQIITSIADWNNAGQKIWDRIDISHKPLPLGVSVDVDYTKKHPEENDWQDAFTSDIVGTEGDSTTLVGVKSRLFAMRITSISSPNGTLVPELLSYSARSNPAPSAIEYELTRYVRLLARDRKDTKAPAVRQDPDATLRSLQNLSYNWIKLYEPNATYTARVESVGTIEPAQPLTYSDTGGDPSKNAYVVELRLVGTRDS